MIDMSEFDPASIPPGFYDWSPFEQAAIAMRMRWCKLARAEQLPPEGDWWIWLLLAGRGFGKTRTAAEDMGFNGLINPDWKMAVVAPTAADVRDVCIEGESGLVAILERQQAKGDTRLITKWNRSIGELILENGTIYKCYPGDEPDRLRGPQAHRTWVDELAAMERQDDCWSNVEMMTRLGMKEGLEPRIIVTTTPRPTKLIRDLVLRSLPKEQRKAARKAIEDAGPSIPDKARTLANPLYACFVQM